LGKPQACETAGIPQAPRKIGAARQGIAMFSVVLIMVGLIATLVSQCAVATTAFTRSVGQGLLCVFVPFYAYQYAQTHSAVNRRLIHAWCTGLALIVAGVWMWSR
jgi:hypothetical protein